MNKWKLGSKQLPGHLNFPNSKTVVVFWDWSFKSEFRHSNLLFKNRCHQNTLLLWVNTDPRSLWSDHGKNLSWQSHTYWNRTSKFSVPSFKSIMSSTICSHDVKCSWMNQWFPNVFFILNLLLSSWVTWNCQVGNLAHLPHILWQCWLSGSHICFIDFIQSINDTTQVFSLQSEFWWRIPHSSFCIHPVQAQNHLLSCLVGI